MESHHHLKQQPRQQEFPCGVHHSFRFSHHEYSTWAGMIVKSNTNSFARPNPDQKPGPWARRPENPLSHMIQGCQQEMLDLVPRVPPEEGFLYELSLRDLVELPALKKIMEEEKEEEKRKSEGDKEKKRKGEENKKRRQRDSRGGNGNVAAFLIKSFMPAVLGGGRTISAAGKVGKVSPKPVAAGDGESRESDYRVTSPSNGSPSRAGGGTRGRMGSCYPFMHSSRSRTLEI